jgi:hypothetical protein
LQRGLPHCEDGSTSDSGDRPEGSLRGKLRKLREVREFRKLRKLRESSKKAERKLGESSEGS